MRRSTGTLRNLPSLGKRLKRSMRQRRVAGQKLFVGYAGRTVPIHLPRRRAVVACATVRHCDRCEQLRVC